MIVATPVTAFNGQCMIMSKDHTHITFDLKHCRIEIRPGGGIAMGYIWDINLDGSSKEPGIFAAPAPKPENQMHVAPLGEKK